MWVSKMEYDALLQTVEDTNKLVTINEQVRDFA